MVIKLSITAHFHCVKVCKFSFCNGVLVYYMHRCRLVIAQLVTGFDWVFSKFIEFSELKQILNVLWLPETVQSHNRYSSMK